MIMPYGPILFHDITYMAIIIMKTLFPRGVEYHVISVRRIIKEYGPSSGLVIELRRIISIPKWANAWLAIERGEVREK